MPLYRCHPEGLQARRTYVLEPNSPPIVIPTRRWKSGALAPRTRAELVGAFSREESAFAFQTDLVRQALTEEHQGRRKQSTCFTAAPRTPRRS